MDFNDYINQLGQLDKQEIEAELSNFYTFNTGLLQFFKGIDNQFEALLNSSSLNAKSVETIITQTNHLLPELNNLKFEISMLEEEKLSDSLKTEIHKTIRYIKEVMVLSEISLTKQRFIKLIQENELIFRAEQQEIEKKKLQEIEEKKRFEQERLEKEKQEKERIQAAEEKKKKEQEEERKRLEKLRIEAEVREQARIVEEKKEKERIEQERLEKEKQEKERIQLEEENNRKEQEKERKRLEKLRIEAEAREQARIAEEKKEKERIAKLEEKRLIKEKFEQEYDIERREVEFKGRKIQTLRIKDQEWMTVDMDVQYMFGYRYFSRLLKDLHNVNLIGWKIPSIRDWEKLVEYSKRDIKSIMEYIQLYGTYWTSDTSDAEIDSFTGMAFKYLLRDPYLKYHLIKMSTYNNITEPRFFETEQLDYEANLRLMRNLNK